MSLFETFLRRSPNATLSATVRWGNSAYDWNTVLTLRLNGGTPTMSRPVSSTLPASGSSNPAIMRSDVVLPHPDGPSIEKNSPRPTVIVTSSTATMVPNFFVTPYSPTSTGASGSVTTPPPGSVCRIGVSIMPAECCQWVTNPRQIGAVACRPLTVLRYS